MLLCDFDAAVQVGDVREGDVLGRFVGEKTRHVFGYGSHGTCEVKQPGAVVGVSVFFFKGGQQKPQEGRWFGILLQGGRFVRFQHIDS